jgi:hypothetical protein
MIGSKKNEERLTVKEVGMSRIDVVADGKGGKVLINYGSLGSFSYSTIAHANKEAKAIHSRQYPHAALKLLEVAS